MSSQFANKNWRDPVITPGESSPAEHAAWNVAVQRGLKISRADLRALLTAALGSQQSVTEMLEAARQRWNEDHECSGQGLGGGHHADGGAPPSG